MLDREIGRYIDSNREMGERDRVIGRYIDSGRGMGERVVLMLDREIGK